MESDDYPSSILTWMFIQGESLHALIFLVVTLLIVFYVGLLNAISLTILSLSREDQNKLEDDESPSAVLLKRFLEKPDYLRLTIRICKVFLNVCMTWFFTYGVLQLIDQAMSHGELLIPTWLLVLLIILSVVFLLFLSEELLPRMYIRNNCFGFAMRHAKAAAGLIRILRPMTSLMVKSSDRIYKNISVKKGTVSMDELGRVFALSTDNKSEDQEMIADIIKFYGKTANEIMTPRLDMEDVDIKSSFKEVIDFVVESGYSRIPVYLDSEDNIKGILYIKDLLAHLDKPPTFRWQSIIRPAYFVPETKKIDDLLEEFRTKKIHMAIVVDEFGGTSGLVTMEDILEEIVGDISDEFDEDEKPYIPLADGSIIFEAKIPLTDFLRITEVDEDDFGKYMDEAETLAGLLLEIKGDMPKRKEVIEHGSYRFQILEADNRRILKVKFSRIEEVEEGESED